MMHDQPDLERWDEDFSAHERAIIGHLNKVFSISFIHSNDYRAITTAAMLACALESQDGIPPGKCVPDGWTLCHSYLEAEKLFHMHDVANYQGVDIVEVLSDFAAERVALQLGDEPPYPPFEQRSYITRHTTVTGDELIREMVAQELRGERKLSEAMVVCP